MSHDESSRKIHALNSAEAQEALKTLDVSWEKSGSEIKRLVTTKTFSQALKLFPSFAEIADELGHHPDIAWTYSHVAIHFTTHDLGGLSNLDFEAARLFDAVIGKFLAG